MMKDDFHLTNTLAVESDRFGCKVEGMKKKEKSKVDEEISRWDQDENRKFHMILDKIPKGNEGKICCKRPAAFVIHNSCDCGGVGKVNKSQKINTAKLSRNMQTSDIDGNNIRNIFSSKRWKRPAFISPLNRIQMINKNKEKIFRLTTLFKNNPQHRYFAEECETLHINSIFIRRKSFLNKTFY